MIRIRCPPASSISMWLSAAAAAGAITWKQIDCVSSSVHSRFFRRAIKPHRVHHPLWTLSRTLSAGQCSQPGRLIHAGVKAGPHRLQRFAVIGVSLMLALRPMGQFSMTISAAAGSGLSDNQQIGQCRARAERRHGNPMHLGFGGSCCYERVRPWRANGMASGNARITRQIAERLRYWSFRQARRLRSTGARMDASAASAWSLISSCWIAAPSWLLGMGDVAMGAPPLWYWT